MKCEIHFLLRLDEDDQITAFACIKKSVILPAVPTPGSLLKLRDLVDIGLAEPFKVVDVLYKDWTNLVGVNIHSQAYPCYSKDAMLRVHEIYTSLLNKGWVLCTPRKEVPSC